jgi:hypothetical protein
MNRAEPNRQTQKARLVRLYITRHYRTPQDRPAACGKDARRWPIQDAVSDSADIMYEGTRRAFRGPEPERGNSNVLTRAPVPVRGTTFSREDAGKELTRVIPERRAAKDAARKPRTTPPRTNRGVAHEDRAEDRFFGLWSPRPS